MPSWTSIVFSLVTFQLAYFLYVLISRLLLSPLANVPGPKLAALTSWYEFYFDAVQKGRFVWKIKDLHSKYGWAVRTRLEPHSLISIISRSHCANYTLGNPREQCGISR